MRGLGLIPSNSTIFHETQGVDQKRLFLRNSLEKPLALPLDVEMRSHLVTHTQACSGHTERTTEIMSVQLKVGMTLLAVACEREINWRLNHTRDMTDTLPVQPHSAVTYIYPQNLPSPSDQMMSTGPPCQQSGLGFEIRSPPPGNLSQPSPFFPLSQPFT